MKVKRVSAVLASLVLAVSTTAIAEVTPAFVTAAIDNPTRSPARKALDASRKPAELLTLIGIKPGDKVVDIIPGGYWDLLFSYIIGPTGRDYMYQPVEYYNTAVPKPRALSFGTAPHHPNLIYYGSTIRAFSIPEPVDIVFIRQNYHDLYDKIMGPADLAAFNRVVFNGLKPGGRYVVIDHSAKDGSGISATEPLHRIDGAVVKRDVIAAGFVLDAESDMLRNPADPRDKVVWDPSIQGKTDQFVYVFRKPG